MSCHLSVTDERWTSDLVRSCTRAHTRARAHALGPYTAVQTDLRRLGCVRLACVHSSLYVCLHS